LRLPSLCVLDLSFCTITIYTPKEFAFSNHIKLSILYIYGNKFHLYENYSYPESELSRLSSLQELHIDVFNGFIFGRNFERLKDLSIIEFHPTGSMFHLQSNTFSGLSKSPIINLTMNFHYQVQCDVSEDTLCSFSFLKRDAMNFGGHCDLDAVLKTVKCSENQTFENFISNGNMPAIVRKFMVLNEHNCKYFLRICVKYVDLKGNHIHGISLDLLSTTFGRCIEHFDISNNSITFFEMTFALHLLRYRYHPKLRYIDFSFNSPAFKDRINGSFNFIWKANATFVLSKVIDVLRYSNNYIHKVPDFSQFRMAIEGESLNELDFSHTSFPCSRITGLNLPHLEILDISENNCSGISRHMLRY
jgi:hypothetical protein